MGIKKEMTVKLKIGSAELMHGIMLAPMAGYTDRAMRRVARDLGCEYSTTEMVSAKAVVYGDKKTFNLARIQPDEGNVAIQIFGSEPDIMADAAAILAGGYTQDGYAAPVAIDINMGCPVNKIFSNGEGSALMRDPDLIYKITRAVCSSIDIPCTVKLRAGIDREHINAVECALAAESAGAALVAIHGRTRAQLYGGESDREVIRNVKNALQIPVIGNGDIVDAESAIAMLNDIGCDGIMIGRAAVGNPFIFSEIIAALENKSYTQPTLSARIEVALKQLSLAVMDKGEAVAVPESRKQIANYFKSFRGSAALRGAINSAKTEQEVRESIYRLLNES